MKTLYNVMHVIGKMDMVQRMEKHALNILGRIVWFQGE